MFSNTPLGELLNNAISGSMHGIADSNHTLLLVNLLLADAEIYKGKNTLPLINECLKPIYGNNGLYTLHEEKPSSRITSYLQDLLANINILDFPSVCAYLIGILGTQLDIKYLPNRKISAIHTRLVRVFHNIHPRITYEPNNITPVLLVGLKGSGKSTLLEALERNGEQVHEIYSELDKARRDKSTLVNLLPDITKWEDEPMNIGFQYRGWSNNWPQRFFVGSLLRLSEIKRLNQIGRPIIIWINTPNLLRHERSKKRGRSIEIHANENRLVELDAHRGGEWPGYETNDVGTLIAMADYHISNNGAKSVNDLAEGIVKIIKKHKGGV